MHANIYAGPMMAAAQGLPRGKGVKMENGSSTMLLEMDDNFKVKGGITLEGREWIGWLMKN